MLGDNARYLNEIKRLIEQARGLGHVAIEKSLYTLLLKQSAPLAMGQDSGRVVDRTSINHDNIIHEFVF